MKEIPIWEKSNLTLKEAAVCSVEWEQASDQEKRA